jgi:hypothetical protein
MMIIVLWHVTSCDLEYRYQRLGGTCLFHLQGTVADHFSIAALCPQDSDYSRICKRDWEGFISIYQDLLISNVNVL